MSLGGPPVGSRGLGGALPEVVVEASSDLEIVAETAAEVSITDDEIAVDLLPSMSIDLDDLEDEEIASTSDASTEVDECP